MYTSRNSGNTIIIRIVVIILIIAGGITVYAFINNRSSNTINTTKNNATQKPATKDTTPTSPAAQQEETSLLLPSPSGINPSNIQPSDENNNINNTMPLSNINDTSTDSNQATQESTQKETTAEQLSQPAPQKTTTPGSYEQYVANKIALAQESDVVLFFHAGWCPTCRSLEKDINANISHIPNNTYILKTNYDTETALKKKYGVTYQHTFVQVDTQGNLIKKWGGSLTLAALLKEIE